MLLLARYARSAAKICESFWSQKPYIGIFSSEALLKTHYKTILSVICNCGISVCVADLVIISSTGQRLKRNG